MHFLKVYKLFLSKSFIVFDKSEWSDWMGGRSYMVVRYLPINLMVFIAGPTTHVLGGERRGKRHVMRSGPKAACHLWLREA
jgi:hypothetical protein